MSKAFQFSLFRLNVIDKSSDGLFSYAPIKNDSDILAVLKSASVSKYDIMEDTPQSSYQWSVRGYVLYDDCLINGSPVVGIDVARSQLGKSGSIVTDENIIKGISSSMPPLADTIHLFFYMKRHLVAVEHNSVITSSGKWRKMLHTIIGKASFDKNFMSDLVLEPIPCPHEILHVFNSFSKLIRLKVKLRLPNPDLTRFTKKLFDDLAAGGIREYKQDMRNAQGLSKVEGALPHASAAMAQDGYKDGGVTMEGLRNGVSTKITTGQDAAIGKLDNLRDFIRGIAANPRTKETRAVVKAILDEMDRLHPQAENNDG